MDRPTVIRARIARARRFGEPEDVIEALRRDYYAARCRDYLREWLASDPAPTPDQRRELAALLAGEADADAA